MIAISTRWTCLLVGFAWTKVGSLINVRWRTADEDVSRPVTMHDKSPVSRRRYTWWRFVGAPSADVVDLPDGSNIDRRCPRSVHAGVGSERRCRHPYGSDSVAALCSIHVMLGRGWDRLISLVG